MAQAYATLKTNIAQQLQDTSMAVYLTAELTEVMDDALRELSDYVPYVLPVSYNIESRTGTATSTSAGKLIDTTKSQFVSGDAGKVIWNTTDYTWAIVVTQDSSSQLTLSKDIMASGEAYEIFHSGCRSKLELNLVDVLDYHTEVEKVEFPVGYNPPRYRNFDMLSANILRMKYDGAVDDSRLTTARKEVLVWVKKRHVVTQNTDLEGAIDLGAGYAAGTTTCHMDGFANGATLEVDQEFTIADMRGIYTVTTAVTVSADAEGEGNVAFYPGLESAVLDNAVVTLKTSTLTPRLETIFCDLCAGKAAISKAHKLLLQANTAITTIGTGATAVALSTARIAQAVTYLGSGDDFIESVNIGEPVGGYAAYCAKEIGNAMARLAEGGGSFNKAGFELRISNAARGLEAWGQNKVNRALADLRRLARPNVSRMYSRG